MRSVCGAEGLTHAGSHGLAPARWQQAGGQAGGGAARIWQDYVEAGGQRLKCDMACYCGRGCKCKWCGQALPTGGEKGCGTQALPLFPQSAGKRHTPTARISINHAEFNVGSETH